MKLNGKKNHTNLYPIYELSSICVCVCEYDVPFSNLIHDHLLIHC